VGRRGPAKVPAGVKLARGETRPSRVNYLEPQPPANAPAMPTDMDDRARAVWARVIAEMAPTGVIRGADADVLRCYCEAVSAYELAQRMLAGSSPLVRTRGELVKNPLHQVVRDARDAVRLFARELGLSPSARAGLSIEIGSDVPAIEAAIGPPPRLRVVGGARR